MGFDMKKGMSCLRAKSTKTRIETENQGKSKRKIVQFKSKIHQNKD